MGDRMNLIIYVCGEKRTLQVGEYLKDVKYVTVIQAKKTVQEYYGRDLSGQRTTKGQTVLY